MLKYIKRGLKMKSVIKKVIATTLLLSASQLTFAVVNSLVDDVRTLTVICDGSKVITPSANVTAADIELAKTSVSAAVDLWSKAPCAPLRTWLKVDAARPAPVVKSSSISSVKSSSVSSSKSSSFSSVASKSSSSLSSSIKSSSSSSLSSSVSSSVLTSIGLITPIAITGSTELQRASYAIDKNSSTRWESKWLTDPSYLILDFSSIQTFSEIEIDWEDSNAKDYNVQGSNDAITWTNLAALTNGVFGQRTDVINLSSSYRYLKLNFTSRPSASSWGYSIYEIRTYGTVAYIPTTITAITLQLYAPAAREDGTLFKPEEIGGYELRQQSADGTFKSIFIPPQKTNPLTYETSLELAKTDTFQIAVFDTNKVYSKFVPVN